MLNDDQPWYVALWRSPSEREAVLALAENEATRLVDLLALVPGERILDVACGNGGEAIALTQRGFQVTGIDLSNAQIDIAQRLAKQSGSSTAFRCADMRDIDDVAEFDAVLVRDVIFGIFDSQTNNTVLQKLVTALRPGGRLLLEVYDKAFALEHGIEGKLRWYPETNRFEGEITSAPEGHPIQMSMELRTANDWHQTLQSLELNQIRISHQNRRILTVIGQKAG